MKKYNRIMILIIAVVLINNCEKGKQEANKLYDKLSMNTVNHEFNGKIVAPMSGRVLSLEEVPDKFFQEKIIGDGIAIEPDSTGIVVAPASGRLEVIFKTNHAFSIVTEEGIAIFIHFGVNTVQMEGAGFERLAEEGSLVKAGDPIIRYDYEFLKENADSIITPIVISNYQEFAKLNQMGTGKNVTAGKDIVLNVEK